MQHYLVAEAIEYETMERFAEKVKEMSDGQLNITVYPADVLVADVEIFDAIASGMIEIAFFSPGYSMGMTPVSGISYFGWGLRTGWDESYAHFDLGLDEILREAYLEHNVNYFATCIVGMPYGGLISKVPIYGLEDFDGVNVRTFPPFANIFSANGASIVTVSGPEIYSALSAGLIDAATWGPPRSMQMLNLQEVGDYYIKGTEGTPDIQCILANPQALDSLPPDLRAILDLAAREASYEMEKRYQHGNLVATRMWKDQGITFIDFSEEDKVEMARLSQVYWDEIAATDEYTARALDVIYGYMEEVGYL
jgi:TRAP-type mannitol/chloroaromatic compound transport system substrate-binding protein